MKTKCVTCGNVFKKNNGRQIYCGSLTKKTGCSWSNHLMQKKGTSEQRKKWKSKQVRSEKEKFSNRIWRNKIKITLQEYKELVKKQNNLCAICNRHENKKSLAIDHNHDTGKIRGLLCQKCNRALGGFCDNSELLNNAFLYLKSYKS